MAEQPELPPSLPRLLITRKQHQQSNLQNLPDNTDELISPEKLRNELLKILQSYFNLAEDKLNIGQVRGLEQIILQLQTGKAIIKLRNMQALLDFDWLGADVHPDDTIVAVLENDSTYMPVFTSGFYFLDRNNTEEQTTDTQNYLVIRDKTNTHTVFKFAGLSLGNNNTSDGQYVFEPALTFPTTDLAGKYGWIFQQINGERFILRENPGKEVDAIKWHEVDEGAGLADTARWEQTTGLPAKYQKGVPASFATNNARNIHYATHPEYLETGMLSFIYGEPSKDVIPVTTAFNRKFYFAPLRSLVFVISEKNIYIINYENGEILEHFTDANPDNVVFAVSSDGSVFAYGAENPLTQATSIKIISAATFETIQTIPLGNDSFNNPRQTYALAYNEVGDKAFAIIGNEFRIYTVSTANLWTLSATIANVSGTEIHLDEVGNKAYLMNPSGFAAKYVVNLSNNTAANFGVNYGKFNDNFSLLYALSSVGTNQWKVYIINPITQTITSESSTLSINLVQHIFNANFTKLFALVWNTSTLTSHIRIYNVADYSLITDIDLTGRFEAIALSADGLYAYVTGYQATRVGRIEIATNIYSSVNVGETFESFEIGVAPLNDVLVLPSRQTPGIAVYDLEDHLLRNYDLNGSYQLDRFSLDEDGFLIEQVWLSYSKESSNSNSGNGEFDDTQIQEDLQALRDDYNGLDNELDQYIIGQEPIIDGLIDKDADLQTQINNIEITAGGKFMIIEQDRITGNYLGIPDAEEIDKTYWIDFIGDTPPPIGAYSLRFYSRPKYVRLNTIAAQNITENSATIIWAEQEESDYYLVWVREQGSNAYLINGVQRNENNIPLSGLDELTDYEVEIVNYFNGYPSARSLTFTFTTIEGATALTKLDKLLLLIKNDASRSGVFDHSEAMPAERYVTNQKLPDSTTTRATYSAGGITKNARVLDSTQPSKYGAFFDNTNTASLVAYATVQFSSIALGNNWIMGCQMRTNTFTPGEDCIISFANNTDPDPWLMMKTRYINSVYSIYMHLRNDLGGHFRTWEQTLPVFTGLNNSAIPNHTFDFTIVGRAVVVSGTTYCRISVIYKGQAFVVGDFLPGTVSLNNFTVGGRNGVSNSTGLPGFFDLYSGYFGFTYFQIGGTIASDAEIIDYQNTGVYN